MSLSSKVTSFFPWRMWLSSTLEVIHTPSECFTCKNSLKGLNGLIFDKLCLKKNSVIHLDRVILLIHYRRIFKEREEKYFSHPCEGNFLRRDGKIFFLPAVWNFFLAFFGLFLLKRGGRGWNTHFWFKKVVVSFFQEAYRNMNSA